VSPVIDGQNVAAGIIGVRSVFTDQGQGIDEFQRRQAFRFVRR